MQGGLHVDLPPLQRMAAPRRAPTPKDLTAAATHDHDHDPSVQAVPLQISPPPAASARLGEHDEVTACRRSHRI
jgi:hypothetical protein